MIYFKPFDELYLKIIILEMYSPKEGINAPNLYRFCVKSHKKNTYTKKSILADYSYEK